MGFLSSAEVIECSASDLVGQYVGQTGPKTKKLLEKGLGKVLFIDEAYRLGQGQFAQEAIDELVGLLTHESYKGKIIVVLAGYVNEIKQLMQVNTGLASRFPEWISFPNMSSKACIDIINKQLAKAKVCVSELLDDTSATYQEMTGVIETLVELPDWGNARDMVTLSTQIVNFALLSGSGTGANLVVDGSDAIACAKTMLQEKMARASIQPKVRKSPPALPVMSSSAAPTPPPVGVGTGTSAQNPPPPPPPVQQPPTPRASSPRGSATRGRGRGRGGRPDPGPRRSPPSSPRTPTTPSPAPIAAAQGNTGVSRDAGVSDQVWNELQNARRRALEAEDEEKRRITKLQNQMRDKLRKMQAERKRQQELERQKAQAQEDARRAELEQQRRAAAEKARRLDEERERAAAAMRAAQKAAAERQRKEEAVQQKLRSMGVCVAGFQWISMGNGYRCAGGFHFVSSQQLGM